MPVSVKLHPALLKRLVGHSELICMDDLRDYDEQIYTSLKYLATEPDVDFEGLDLRFTLIKPNGEEIDLCPGGHDLAVTEDNI